MPQDGEFKEVEDLKFLDLSEEEKAAVTRRKEERNTRNVNILQGPTEWNSAWGARGGSSN